MHAASSPRRLRRQATELAPRRRCLAFCALACCVLPGVLVVRLVMLKASGFAGLQLDTRSILALIRAHDRPDDVLFGVRRADRGAAGLARRRPYANASATAAAEHGDGRATTSTPLYFPLFVKFHKVGGTTALASIVRELRCSGAARAWRARLCGAYDHLQFSRAPPRTYIHKGAPGR